MVPQATTAWPRFAVSSTNRLTIEGLVKVMPRKGVIVTPISLDDFIAASRCGSSMKLKRLAGRRNEQEVPKSIGWRRI
jgi:hypothetical protein